MKCATGAGTSMALERRETIEMGCSMVDLMKHEFCAKGSAMKRLAAIALSAGICLALAQSAIAQEQAAPEAPAASVPAEPAPAPVAPAETTPSAPAAQAPESPAPAASDTPATAQDGAQAPAPAATEPAQDAEAAALPLEDGARDMTLPHDLSPWGMFMAADWVVKAVMLGLAFASLVTWTVWLAKSLELAGSKARLRSALRAILGSTSLQEAAQKLDKRRDAGALLVNAAMEETRLSIGALDHADPSGLKERVFSRLSRIQIQTGRRLSRGTGVLATIGSTAPFVGLFGTVWGIMNSFIGISESQTTNLAVVAPGIAEALLATAIGLVAAIPAVVIYNVFSRSITGYRQALADAAAGVDRLVSRDLDFRLVPAASRDRLAAE